jgi:hypothetical protein
MEPSKHDEELEKRMEQIEKELIKEYAKKGIKVTLSWDIFCECDTCNNDGRYDFDEIEETA